MLLLSFHLALIALSISYTRGQSTHTIWINTAICVTAGPGGQPTLLSLSSAIHTAKSTTTSGRKGDIRLDNSNSASSGFIIPTDSGFGPTLPSSSFSIPSDVSQSSKSNGAFPAISDQSASGVVSSAIDSVSNGLASPIITPSAQVGFSTRISAQTTSLSLLQL